MRISRFAITNYRGIRSARLDSLEHSPLILLTGRNGTGKSLVLEALTAAWSGNINMPDLVGPYGDSLSVEIDVQLTSSEYETVNRWRLERGMWEIQAADHHTLEATSTKREMTGRYSQRDELLDTLQNPLFAETYPFASIDLLSARRQSSMDTSTAVDLSILDRTSAANQRRALYEQEIRWKQSMQMPDIGSYLSSLDYRNYVAQRDGLQPTDEYERIQSIFFEATGKSIKLPSYDPETTKSSIDVELPSGARHRLADLSNGERELLGMLYYVSQLNAQGGVLLLDEPEKHLHPTLQLAALRAMTAIADRGQLFVVTHSPGIISSSPAEQVVVVEPAWLADANQLQPVSDVDGQADLLSALGLASRDLLQTNYLLIVEGPDDEKRLRMLLPTELAGAKIVTAGGVERALSMAASLRGLDIGVPWLCVIDRDFMTPDEVTRINADGQVFVWQARMLENILLESEMLPGLLSIAGGSTDTAQAQIMSAIEAGRDQSMRQFIDTRINRAMPADPSRPNMDDRTLRDLLEQRDLWNYRVEQYDRLRGDVTAEFDSGWSANWALFVDGKRVFSELQRSSQIFKNTATLVDSLMVRMREEPERLPQGVLDLKSRLAEFSRPQHTITPFAPSASVGQTPDLIEPDPTLNASTERFYGGC